MQKIAVSINSTHIPIKNNEKRCFLNSSPVFTDDEDDEFLPRYAIALIAAGGVLPLTVVVIAVASCCYQCHRRRKMIAVFKVKISNSHSLVDCTLVLKV